MKAKSIFIGIAVAAIFLLVLSFTAVSKVLSANPSDLLQGVKTQPQAVNFLPKRSPLFFSFLVNPDRLSLFAQLAAKSSDRASIKNEFRRLKQQLQQEWALDYDSDIQPWVGNEITLAVTTTDIDRQSDNGLQPGYLLAFSTSNVELTKASVEKFWQRQAIGGSDLGFEQYQGIPIVFANTPLPNLGQEAAIASATIGKFVLFANDVKVIRNAINDLQVPDLALAGLDTYKASVKQLTQGRIGLAFANFAELSTWGTAGGVLPKNLTNLPKAVLSLGLGLDRQGLEAETVLTLDPLAANIALAGNHSNAKAQNQKNSNPITELIPAGSSVLVGRNLSQTLQQISTTLKPYPELNASFTSAIAALTANSSLSFVGSPVEEANREWLQGDYAIAALPNALGKSDWVLIAENKAPSAVKAAIDRLDALARNAKLTVGDLSLNDRNLTVWTQLTAVTNPKDALAAASINGSVAIAHTKIAPNSKYVIFSNSIEAVEKVLSSDRDSIARSPRFKNLAEKLPSNLSGFAYIDRKTNLDDWIAKFPLLPTTLKALQGSPLQLLLDHIEVINLASTATNGSSLRGEISIALK
ncbi:DUF3352 domain-containing protein [Tumidithrix helvetica PCC 7403]|uniref:DUF3352 domain-containing protein n=1 Tax=Tumidithrix helvetica TaxID=3457545 RepID=UPI003CA0A5A3